MIYKIKKPSLLGWFFVVGSLETKTTTSYAGGIRSL